MSLELAFELYPEIYEQLFRQGKELANFAKDKLGKEARS